MKRFSDKGVFSCPICNQFPKISLKKDISSLSCEGYGMHRHKKVSAIVFTQDCDAEELEKKLIFRWNQLKFEEVRFIFEPNGNPFTRIAKEKLYSEWKKKLAD